MNHVYLVHFEPLEQEDVSGEDYDSECETSSTISGVSEEDDVSEEDSDSGCETSSVIWLLIIFLCVMHSLSSINTFFVTRLEQEDVSEEEEEDDDSEWETSYLDGVNHTGRTGGWGHHYDEVMRQQTVLFRTNKYPKKGDTFFLIKYAFVERNQHVYK